MIRDKDEGGGRHAENLLAALLPGIPDFNSEELEALLRDLPGLAGARRRPVPQPVIIIMMVTVTPTAGALVTKTTVQWQLEVEWWRLWRAGGCSVTTDSESLSLQARTYAVVARVLFKLILYDAVVKWTY